MLGQHQHRHQCRHQHPRLPSAPALLAGQAGHLAYSFCREQSRLRSSSKRASGAHPVRCNARPTSSLDEERVLRSTSYTPEDGPSTSSTPIVQDIPPGATQPSYNALVAWVAAAVAFGAGIWYVQGAEKAQEYFAGYLLEQSLSVDNLFVFILVFKYFNTPPDLQKTVLTYGIGTAAVLRAVMIILGVELISEFQPLLLVFAGILLFSSYQLLAPGSEDEDDEDLSNNSIVAFCKKLIPVSSNYDGNKFFTVENGQRIATPLLLTLAVVELSDVVFAVDSIPAVFGVTLDPFIVYTSNIFAILSLRALYTFVANVMTELRYLDKAVAIVLGFIGAKMVLGFADVHIPTDVSLLVVAAVLGGGVGASLLLPEPQEAD